MTKDKPAEWAIERACDLANREPTAPEGTHWRPENIGPGGIASAFARYIEENEDEPDPVSEALDEIVYKNFRWQGTGKVIVEELRKRGITLTKEPTP